MFADSLANVPISMVPAVSSDETANAEVYESDEVDVEIVAFY